MNLYTKPVAKNDEDIQKVLQLNNEAFPKEERMDINKFLDQPALENMDFSMVYDEKTFVGFFVLMLNERTAYISFFAIDGAQRSKGYGGKVLALIASKYPTHQVVLDIEKEEESAANYEQRKARKQFYLRNGYLETGYFMKYAGITFEVLSNNKSFDKESFALLLDEIRILSAQIGGVVFQPTLFME